MSASSKNKIKNLLKFGVDLSGGHPAEIFGKLIEALELDSISWSNLTSLSNPVVTLYVAKHQTLSLYFKISDLEKKCIYVSMDYKRNNSDTKTSGKIAFNLTNEELSSEAIERLKGFFTQYKKERTKKNLT